MGRGAFDTASSDEDGFTDLSSSVESEIQESEGNMQNLVAPPADAGLQSTLEQHGVAQEVQQCTASLCDQMRRISALEEAQRGTNQVSQQSGSALKTLEASLAAIATRQLKLEQTLQQLLDRPACQHVESIPSHVAASCSASFPVERSPHEKHSFLVRCECLVKERSWKSEIFIYASQKWYLTIERNSKNRLGVYLNLSPTNGAVVHVRCKIFLLPAASSKKTPPVCRPLVADFSPSSTAFGVQTMIRLKNALRGEYLASAAASVDIEVAFF